MYPIQFYPIYKEMLWGGQKMAAVLGRELPYTHTGESWDISCRPNEMGVVSNGPLAGRRFQDILDEDRKKYLGRALSGQEEFSLLVKIIDANDNLSVQVHPDDTYAKKAECYPYGKNEMWYVLDAPEDGRLIIGLRPEVTREGFRKAFETGRVAECLNELPVKKGDVIDIPAGLVHALTKGVMVAEIQQNSDITYRMFDYDRIGLDGKKRELHLEKALDVADFQGKLKKDCVTGLVVRRAGADLTYYIANENFVVIRYEVDTEIDECSDPDRFHIYTGLEGDCRIVTPQMTVTVPIGGSVLVPAAMGSYRITGKGALLKSFVPDIEHDFVRPLIDHGYRMEDILAHTVCNGRQSGD